MPDISNFRYPLDPTGILASNKIVNERHVLTGSNSKHYYTIVPKLAPYFADSLVVEHTAPDGTVRRLALGVDYLNGYWFIGASRATAKPVYGGIVILDLRLRGGLTITYQTLGGEWVLDEQGMLAVLAEYEQSPIVIGWEQVANPPKAFPPEPHELELQDLIGQEDLVTAVDNIANAIRNGPNGTGGGGGGTSKTVTKETIGLGNVVNLGLMPLTTAAVTSAANNFYTTPASVRMLLEHLILADYRTYKTRDDNPHNVTAEQVDTYNKATIDNKLTKYLPLTGKAVDSELFDGLTTENFKATLTDLSVRNATRIANRTVDELITEVLNRVRADETFGGMTPAEFINHIKASSLNATTWLGKDYAGYLEWLNAQPNLNAKLLEGSTKAQIIAKAREGLERPDAVTIDGLTVDDIIDRVVTRIGTNAETLSNLTLDQIRTQFLNSTIANANKVYNLDKATLTSEILAGTSANATKAYNLTKQQLIAETLTGTAANSLRLESKTLEEVTDLALDKVLANFPTDINATKFGNYTTAQFLDLVKQQTLNATTFNGRNTTQFLEWLNTQPTLNASKLSNKTLAQIMSDVNSAVTTQFPGLLTTHLPTEIAKLSLDAATLRGNTVTQILASAKAQTADNAAKLEGTNKADILAAAAAAVPAIKVNNAVNADKLGNKTLTQVMADVVATKVTSASAADNATTLAGNSLTQILASAKAQTSDNSAKLEGLTKLQLIDEIKNQISAIKVGSATNADTLAGKTLTEILATAKAQTADNSAKLEGLTKTALLTEFLTSVVTTKVNSATNSDKLGNKTLTQLMADVVTTKVNNAVTADNATALGGKTLTQLMADVVTTKVNNAVTADNATTLAGKNLDTIKQEIVTTVNSTLPTTIDGRVDTALNTRLAQVPTLTAFTTLNNTVTALSDTFKYPNISGELLVNIANGVNGSFRVEGNSVVRLNVTGTQTTEVGYNLITNISSEAAYANKRHMFSFILIIDWDYNGSFNWGGNGTMAPGGTVIFANPATPPVLVKGKRYFINVLAYFNPTFNPNILSTVIYNLIGVTNVS